MTLVEKIQRLKSMSGGLRVDMKDTYASKGVIIPIGTLPTLNELPSITSRIPQLDFEFFFHFDDVDQFGNPRFPRRGQAAGGNSYTPALTVTDLKTIDLFIEHYTAAHPSLLTGKGDIWGNKTGSSNITPAFAMDDVVVLPMSEFIFPAVFSPSVDDPSTVVPEEPAVTIEGKTLRTTVTVRSESTTADITMVDTAVTGWDRRWEGYTLSKDWKFVMRANDTKNNWILERYDILGSIESYAGELGTTDAEDPWDGTWTPSATTTNTTISVIALQYA